MRYLLAFFLTTPAAAMTVQGSLSVTGTGNTTYSVTTSSGVNVQAGGIVAPWVNARVTPGNVDLSTAAAVGTCTGVNFVQVLGNSGPTCAQPSNVSGNAATATALAATPTKCSAGNFPLGVDAQGNAQNCTAAAGGTVTTQGSPTAGQVPVFQGGTVLSSSPISVAYGANGTSTVTIGVAASSVTFSTSSYISGIPGGVIASSVGISGAASTTLSNLNGNRDGSYRIVIDGRATGTDGALNYLLPNNDTGSHYTGTCWFQDTVDAWAGVNWTATSGMGFFRNATTNTNSFHTEIVIGASTAAGGYRCMNGNPGWASEGGTYRGFENCGGCWTDTSSNITSITINWNTKFTGSVYVYRDQP